MQYIDYYFKQPDATKRMNFKRLGAINPGLYRGFDFVPSADLTLGLAHNVNNIFQETKTDLTQTNPLGVVVTKMGVDIKEDATISLTISPTTTHPRIDLIVCTHEQVQSSGGDTAIYSVIQGVAAASPVAPALTFPTYRVLLGTLNLPAYCTALNQSGVRYVKEMPPFYNNKPNWALSPIEAVIFIYSVTLDYTTGDSFNLVTASDGSTQIGAISTAGAIAGTRIRLWAVSYGGTIIATGSSRGYAPIADPNSVLGLNSLAFTQGQMIEFEYDGEFWQIINYNDLKPVWVPFTGSVILGSGVSVTTAGPTGKEARYRMYPNRDVELDGDLLLAETTDITLFTMPSEFMPINDTVRLAINAGDDTTIPVIINLYKASAALTLMTLSKLYISLAGIRYPTV